MTPQARVQAAIEILDDIFDGNTAERALTSWARSRRFAGSKDRAAIRDIVFDALRSRQSYGIFGGRMTGRGLMIGALRESGTDIESVFNGIGHAPIPLGDDEKAEGRRPTAREAMNLPDWLCDAFDHSLGEEAPLIAQILRDRAPITLRVNLSKSTPQKAMAALEQEGIVTQPVAGIETALRVIEGARRIPQSAPFEAGVVELQDAHSQAIVDELCHVSHSKILDYCAGGGGKSLAFAGRRSAQIYAHDIDPNRMKDLPIRAARAGAKVTILSTDALAQHGPYDLVLCDAPCSGSGSWRRAPEAKWALTPGRLAELAQIQADILDKASALVAPGGRLAYVTCSILDIENEKQSQFFSGRTSLELIATKNWYPDAIGDGFYLALWQKP